MQYDLKVFYQEKAAALKTEAASLRRQTRRFVVAELVTFVLAAAFAVAYALTDWGWLLLVVAGLLALAYLWIRARDVSSSARLEECDAWLRVYEGELAALEGDFSRFDGGDRYADVDHPFTTDLDIFGPESLFQRLNRTVTTGGSDLLAAILSDTQVPTTEGIQARNQEIRRLAEEEVLRTTFMAQEKVETSSVLQALQAVSTIHIPTFARSIVALLLAVVLLGGFYVLLLASILNFVNVSAVIAWALLEVFIASLCFARSLQQTKRATEGILRQLKVYSRLMALVPETADARSAFVSLTSIVDSIDRRNEFWVLFSNAFFMADLFIVRRFLAWKRRYMPHIPQWIEAVSRYDALVSLATFCFNHPEASDAEVLDSEDIVFEAQGLWHPFLGATAVRNDFRLNDGHYYIITGANMAGKSTFLRSVGINVLLARMGLPVFAEHLRCSSFALFTSMRTTDDLAHGISYFNAELLRLQQLLEAVKGNAHTLIILDEILKGTNSLDKLNGSRLFLEAVSELPVTGIIATHDLELSRMADEHPDRFHNLCFEIQLSDHITYTYHITPGVARNQNATYLLRQLLGQCASPTVEV